MTNNKNKKNLYLSLPVLQNSVKYICKNIQRQKSLVDYYSSKVNLLTCRIDKLMGRVNLRTREKIRLYRYEIDKKSFEETIKFLNRELTNLKFILDKNISLIEKHFSKSNVPNIHECLNSKKSVSKTVKKTVKQVVKK